MISSPFLWFFRFWPVLLCLTIDISCKCQTDKISVLDDVIKYIKALQNQILVILSMTFLGNWNIKHAWFKGMWAWILTFRSGWENPDYVHWSRCPHSPLSLCQWGQVLEWEFVACLVQLHCQWCHFPWPVLVNQL